MIPSSTLTTPAPSSTDGAPPPNIRLWPYMPGVYGRDALYQLWRLLEAEHLTQRAFWDRALYPDTCGDLASFIKTFDGHPSNQLAFVADADGARLLGCIWLSDIIPQHQAFISIAMLKAGRRMAKEAGAQALEYVFEAYGFQQLWSLTPWQRAWALAQQLGFQKIGIMPAYCRFPDATFDVHILRLTKEDWHGQGSAIHSRTH